MIATMMFTKVNKKLLLFKPVAFAMLSELNVCAEVVFNIITAM